MSTINVTPGDNLQGAANNLRPGDTLLLKAGTHYGRISIPVDGVVIAGEAGAIIDATAPLADLWELATDSDGITSLAGSGTWRMPLSSWPWIVMESAGNMIMRIDSDFVGVCDWNNYWGMSAYSALAVPNNARPGPDYGADWWNGVEAMWVWNPGNKYLYVRYRDGHRPATLRWSGGHTDHREPPTAAGSVIWLAGRRNVVINSLEIRGAVDGIAIVDSSNVTIQHCRFRAFDFAVQPYGSCQDLWVGDSHFNLCLIGTNAIAPIAKISTQNPYPDARLTAYHVYAMYKFWHDESDSTHGTGLRIRNSWNESTQTIGVPRNVEFANNHVEHCVFGVDCFGGDGIQIHHNDVHNMIDMAFQRSPDGGRNIKIHDNRAREGGYCLFRWHASEDEAGDNYVYNNRISDIDQVSDFVFHARRAGTTRKKNWFLNLLLQLWLYLRDFLDVICFGRLKASHSQLRVWHYHNSYSGGNSVWLIEGLLSMPGFFAVNNVLSNGGLTSNAAGWPSEMGGFDYNSMSGGLGAYGGWYGAHNLTNMAPIWPCRSDVEADFVIPAGHPAKASGIDVSQPFTIAGKICKALPGFEPGYFEGAAPDRGWIDRGDSGGDIVAATLTVAPDSIAPGADVEISWTGGTSARDWYACYKIGEQHEFDKYGWAYTSSCAGSPGTIKPSGTCIFTMPDEVGSYEFHLYADDGGMVIAISNQVNIQEPEPAPEPQPEPPEAEMVLALIPVWVFPEDVEPVKDLPGVVALKKKIRKKGF